MRLFRHYLLLLAACTIAVVLTAMIPHDAIKKHCQASIAHLVEGEEYPQAFGLPFLKTDNFTDLLMLNEAWCSDEAQPVKASMMNYFSISPDDNLFKASRQLITQPSEQPPLREYSRYWHGFQIILRPLLVLTDYRHLIIVNYLLLTLLALWSLYEVWWRCSPTDSISLAIVLLLTAFYAVPLCFQYSVTYYIMFLFLITLMRREKQGTQSKRNDADTCFFIVGALTAFFDLLTTPTLTLGIPLLIYIRSQEQRSRTLGQAIRLSACWSVGYGALWSGKILVAWLLTGRNILDFFLQGVHARSILGLNTLGREIMSHPLISVVALIVIVLLIWSFTRHATCQNRYGWLLFIAMIPFFWYIILLQHTVIHFFFVWRTLAITLLSLLMLGGEIRTTRETRHF